MRIKPEYVEAHHNLGNVLRSGGRAAEAIASYTRALELNPDHVHVHLSRAMAWLEMGDYRLGWPEFDWRLKFPQYAIPAYRQRAWDGRSKIGKTVLLHADHGLGDAIQFIRYAPMVRERCSRVIVVCRAELARLLATCAGVDLVVVEGAPLPDFDVHISLMSLPGIFGTDGSSIPADVPYLFADAELVRQRVEELPTGDEFCIGVAWQGNPDYNRDRFRSFRLEQLEPVLARAGVRAAL